MSTQWKRSNLAMAFFNEVCYRLKFTMPRARREGFGFNILLNGSVLCPFIFMISTRAPVNTGPDPGASHFAKLKAFDDLRSPTQPSCCARQTHGRIHGTIPYRDSSQVKLHHGDVESGAMGHTPSN